MSSTRSRAKAAGFGDADADGQLALGAAEDVGAAPAGRADTPARDATAADMSGRLCIGGRVAAAGG